jgi:hypothetical protein
MLLWQRRGAGWPPVAPPTTAEVLLRADPLVSAVGAVVMASRQESVSRRLKRAGERARDPHSLLKDLHRLPIRDWNDQEDRAISANLALTLDRTDSTLREAFKTFGLDPKNPLNWRYLLLYLVEILFKRLPKGPPPKWNTDRWTEFQNHVAIARTCLASNGGKFPSQERVAEFLKERFKQQYGHLSPSTIRRYFTLPPPAVRKSRKRKR